MGNTNLLKETRECLEELGLTFDDILYIGNGSIHISKDHFFELADVYYNDSYGSAEIVTDIKLIGTNFMFVRREYDGSEWWEYQCIPNTIKSKQVKLKSLKVSHYIENMGSYILDEMESE